jgi:hypothetical protein
MLLAHSTAPERLHPPEHFQRRITQAGGLNRYRQPMFRLAWAQTETRREGGEWESEGDWFRGYRDTLLGDGLPHWMLLQWVDAGMCIEMPHVRPVSYVSWYQDLQCPKTGLQLRGEYPYQGSYQIALSLVAKIFTGGQLYIEAFPLSTEIIEMMVPIIKASLLVSHECKMRFMRDQNEKEEEERTKTFGDAYDSIKMNPNLHAGWLEDKQRNIEKHFNAGLIAMMHRNKRFQAQRRPNA